ncbi:unnamed protein product [Gadus morhua 'NCC']
MVKPQSQHSGGRGVEQAGYSYAGDGEASWTAPGVNSSLAGQQVLNSRLISGIPYNVNQKLGLGFLFKSLGVPLQVVGVPLQLPAMRLA